MVGDLNGCYDELTDLLGKLNFGLHDRLIAVGDLIVKGPKISLGAITRAPANSLVPPPPVLALAPGRALQ